MLVRYLKKILLICSLILTSCFSQMQDEAGLQDTLVISKSETDLSQIIDSLELEKTQTVQLFSLSKNNKTIESAQVQWSVYGSIGTLLVDSSGVKATFTAENIGSGGIQIESENGSIQSLTINVVASSTRTSAFSTSSVLLGTEKTLSLPYTNNDGLKATECNVSNLLGVEIVDSCSCDSAGDCSLSYRVLHDHSSVASLEYSVKVDGISSNESKVTLNYLSCPTGYIPVEGMASYSVDDFCVMKYEAKDVSSEAISRPDLTPWVNVSVLEAFGICSVATETGYSGEFALISNSEWMSIARNIENIDDNWSGGSVGSGCVYMGNNGYDTTCSYSNSFAPDFGVSRNSKAKLKLNSGAEIYDFAGNVWEFVDWSTADSVFTRAPTDGSPNWRELSVLSGSFTKHLIGPQGSFDSSHGMGKWYGSMADNNWRRGYTIRGGDYDDITDNPGTGIYSIALNATTDNSAAVYVGFRCVYRP